MRRLVPAVALLLLGLAPACGGGGGAPPPGPGGGTAPANLSYSESPAWYRAGTAIPTNAASWTGGAPTLFEVAPPLPAGLLLDAVSGDVTGTPVAPAAPALFTFTASNAAGSDSVDVQIAVGDPLPAAFASLAPGFNAEVVMEGLMVPVKIAMAGDGRIFFNELMTGDTRIILADGTLQAQVFAHADLVLGPHQGLLGLVLHPAFDTDPTKRWVYTMTCTPGTGPLVDRIQVKRYLEVGGVGTGETIVVDDLPMGAINNGGDLLFGPDQVVPGDGGLFVSLGDTDDPNLAQTDGSLAGRILRYTEDGAPHPDNPKPITDPFEWDRGLRNTFCLAVHPVTGDLYGADNGPAANDWLHYQRGGKNFQWPSLPPNTPPGDVGIRITGWLDVIVPTGLAWHTGEGWGPVFVDDLFLTSYDDQAIRRLEMSATPPNPEVLNVDAETIFATFDLSGGLDNKPLDIFLAPPGVPGVPAGALYVSTFTGIYRIVQD